MIARDVEGVTTAASLSITEGPGSVLVSLVAPTVLTGGPAEALAALATTLIAWRTRNLLLAMLVGVSVTGAVPWRATPLVNRCHPDRAGRRVRGAVDCRLRFLVMPCLTAPALRRDATPGQSRTAPEVSRRNRPGAG